MIHTRKILLGAILLCLLTAHAYAADNLVGLWKTETDVRTFPGYTNEIRGFKTAEFFKDLSIELAHVSIIDGKPSTNLMFTGTYAVVSTNRVSLKPVPRNVPPGSGFPPVNVSCSRSGDKLDIPRF